MESWAVSLGGHRGRLGTPQLLQKLTDPTFPNLGINLSGSDFAINPPAPARLPIRIPRKPSVLHSGASVRFPEDTQPGLRAKLTFAINSPKLSLSNLLSPSLFFFTKKRPQFLKQNKPRTGHLGDSPHGCRERAPVDFQLNQQKIPKTTQPGI